MKNLKFAGLFAAGLLAMTACGAKAVSFEDWKKKADACQDKEYKTATLKVHSLSKDAEGSEDKLDATYTYTFENGAWKNNEKDGADYLYEIGMKAKDAFKADPSTSSYKYTFYSDLTVKFEIDSVTALAGNSITIKGNGTAKFNGNGYLVSTTSKTKSEVKYSDDMKSLGMKDGTATSESSYTISYK